MLGCHGGGHGWAFPPEWGSVDTCPRRLVRREPSHYGALVRLYRNRTRNRGGDEPSRLTQAYDALSVGMAWRDAQEAEAKE